MRLTPFPKMFGAFLLLYQMRSDPKLQLFTRTIPADEREVLDMLTDVTRPLTVFALNNDAMGKVGDIGEDFFRRHAVRRAITEEELEIRDGGRVDFGERYLWVTKRGKEIFVNGAKVVRTLEIAWRNGVLHVLHIIDAPLFPTVSPPFSTALDVFSYPNLFPSNTFLTILDLNNLVHLYNKTDTQNTYFIPLDDAFDHFHKNTVDETVIKGHIIAGRVLFNPPTLQHFNYEVRGNSRYFHMEVCFDGEEVRAVTTRGDEGHPIGYFRAKIVVGNIPVQNGVVHLIDNLLVVKKKKAVFPYVSMWQKVSSDPVLNISNSYADVTDVNRVLTDESVRDKFTYFVPVDCAWEGLVGNEELFGRHLVLSKVPYSMEMLEIYSKVLKDGYVRLNSLSDELEIKVEKCSDGYVIWWKNRKIRVVTPDVVCTNGIVHEIDGVFLE